jgi:hypothetical protein
MNNIHILVVIRLGFRSGNYLRLGDGSRVFVVALCVQNVFFSNGVLESHGEV